MFKSKSALRSTLCGVSLSLLSISANAVVLDDEAAASSNVSIAASQVDPAYDIQLIVKYKPSAFAQQSVEGLSASQNAVSTTAMAERVASRAMGVKMKHLRKMATGAHVMKMPREKGKRFNNSKMQSMIAALQADPNVEYVEVDRMLKPMATPNDPQYTNQWHYYEATGGLRLPTAWDTTTGTGAVVAILDTGITSHPDLNANNLPGYDMITSATVANDGNGRDSNPADTGDATVRGECGPNQPPVNRDSSWHGTHVAGTVAAVGNNNTGVTGVAYTAKLVNVRVLGKCGGFTSDIADGIIWAAGGSVAGVPNNANPADVINLSLGGSGACDATSQAAHRGLRPPASRSARSSRRLASSARQCADLQGRFHRRPGGPAGLTIAPWRGPAARG